MPTVDLIQPSSDVPSLLRDSYRGFIAELTERGEKFVPFCLNNAASAQIIRNNGGVLESEEYLHDRAEVVQRYVINIADHHQA